MPDFPWFLPVPFPYAKSISEAAISTFKPCLRPAPSSPIPLPKCKLLCPAQATCQHPDWPPPAPSLLASSHPAPRGMSLLRLASLSSILPSFTLLGSWLAFCFQHTPPLRHTARLCMCCSLPLITFPFQWWVPNHQPKCPLDPPGEAQAPMTLLLPRVLFSSFRPLITSCDCLD